MGSPSRQRLAPQAMSSLSLDHVGGRLLDAGRQVERPGQGEGVLRVPPGHDLVMTVDTLVEGVHFFPGTPAHAVGHKALAVNLSDLAAMGAQPAWVSAALSLPGAPRSWMQAFRAGLGALARRHGVEIRAACVGRGPTSVTLQAYGLSPGGRTLRRSGASPGDAIYVTGTVGDAGLAVERRRSGAPLPRREGVHVNRRLDYPEPRVAVGRALHGIASAAIDVSDGLVADLQHILEASEVGARVQVGSLPLSGALRAAVPLQRALGHALGGGDDYELCFTVPPSAETALRAAAADLDVRLTRIGTVEPDLGLRLEDGAGAPVAAPGRAGYRHFDGAGDG